ncbi:MAG: hypothetical protein KDC38_14170, partial [Planctomycetes bacterium]|nr:hypothetical protein [Planctomycetota bacterium]
GSGGAIFAGSGVLGGDPNLIVVNCLFTENGANIGGAIFNASGRAGVTNCTFTANTAVTNGSALSAESVTITNSIIWGNGPSPIASTPWEVNYSNVEGGWAGVGNLDIDPQFTALHELDATSPCIDAGSNAADLDPVAAGTQPLPSNDLAQAPRFQDVPDIADTGLGTAPIVDMGCFERAGSPVTIAFIRGDANNDGAIDIGDPILVTNYLFASGVAPPCLDAADSNDDDAVDIGDAITTLDFLFASGPLPSPGTSCGSDPTDDTLDCAASSCP